MIRSLLSRLRRPASPRRPAAARLRLVNLEDRVTPSAWTVRTVTPEVNELDSGFVTFWVERPSDGDLPADSITIAWGGTATYAPLNQDRPGVDYFAPTARTETIEVLEGVSRVTVTAYPKSGDGIEPDETITLTVDGSSTATVILHDGDTPKSVRVAVDGPTEVTEGEDLRFRVTREGDVRKPAQVKYTFAGTATAGPDFTGGPGVLDFAADERTKTITVPTLPDDSHEPNETVVVRLASPSTGTVIAGHAVTGTILDDDPAAMAVAGVSSTLPDESAPGEKCTVTVTLTNGPGGKAYAAAGQPLFTVYALANGQRFEIGKYAAAGPVTLAPNQSRAFQVKCEFPALGADQPWVPEGEFRYEAVLTANWGGGSGTSADPSQHLYQFGKVGNRTGVALQVQQSAAGLTETTYTLSGPGTGSAAYAGGLVDLAFTGTTTASTVAAAAAGAGASVQDITAGDLGTLSMPNVDVTGQLSFGTLDTLNVRELGGDPGSVLTIGGGSAAGAAVAGRAAAIPKEAKDVRAAVIKGDIVAPNGVARIVAGKWLDDDPGVDLKTPFLRFLTVGGEMQADLDITGPPARGQALVQATVGGAVKDSVWRLRDPGGAGRIQVGSGDEWQLLADGPVTLLQVKGNYKQRTDNTEPSLRAASFGTLELLGNTDARSIEVTGQADQAAIGRLNVRQVFNLDTLTATAGGIRSLESAGWGADTAIVTQWVGTLTVKADPKLILKGDFRADLHLTGKGPDGKTSLASATVEKDVTGTWEAFGNVGPVKAGTIGWTFTGGVGDGSPGTDLMSLDATTVDTSTTKAHFIGPVRAAKVRYGSIEADRLTSLTAKKDPKVANSGSAFSFALHITGPGSHTIWTVDEDITDSSITVDKPDSGFASITARSWKGGGVQGGYIGTLKLTGDLDVSPISGTKPPFNLTGHSPAGHSLDQLDVKGDVTADFTFGRDVGTVSAGGFRNSTFTADGHRIDRFEVRPQQKGGPIPVYEATAVKAQTIGVAVLRGVVTGTTSSVTAKLIERYVRFAGGVIAAQGVFIDKAKVDAGQFNDQEGGYSVVLEA